MRSDKKKNGPQPIGLFCLRCGTELLYAGNFKFHEGANMGVLGNLFEFAVNRESFDVCKCPNCGKAEFFDMAIKNNTNNNGKGDC